MASSECCLAPKGKNSARLYVRLSPWPSLVIQPLSPPYDRLRKGSSSRNVKKHGTGLPLSWRAKHERIATSRRDRCGIPRGLAGSLRFGIRTVRACESVRGALILPV